VLEKGSEKGERVWNSHRKYWRLDLLRVTLAGGKEPYAEGEEGPLRFEYVYAGENNKKGDGEC